MYEKSGECKIMLPLRVHSWADNLGLMPFFALLFLANSYRLKQRGLLARYRRRLPGIGRPCASRISGPKLKMAAAIPFRCFRIANRPLFATFIAKNRTASMPSSKKLAIFTDSYPYGSAEPFLKTELEYLSKDFAHITLIPLSYGTSRAMRELPANVTAVRPILTSSKDKGELLVKGLINCSPAASYMGCLGNEHARASSKSLWSWGIGLLLSRAVLANSDVKRILRDASVGTLYFYWGIRSSYIIPLLPAGLGKKIAVRFHGSDTYEETNGGYIPLRTEQLMRMDMAFFCSDFGRKYVRNRYPFMESKSTLSRLGVLHKGYGKASSDGIFRIVTLSNMVPLKRLDLLANALKECTARIEWTHIGDGETRQEVEAIASEFPNNITARFLGRIPNESVISYMTTSPIDLFVNVSSSEGVPVSIMEALSFGIPVLATAVGGTPEIVDNAVGQLVVPAITPKELASHISQLAASAPALLQKRENARSRWEERCNAEMLYQAFSTRLLNL